MSKETTGSKKYVYRNRVVFVTKRNGGFRTVFQSKTGLDLHPINLSELPFRLSEAEAQADLDTFAAKRMLKEVKSA